MSDLISRQAAIDAVGDVHPLDYNGQAILHRIQQLPSAEKHGRWISVSPMVDTEECSVCGFQIQTSELETPYCPWCGAKMERSEE